MVLFKVFFVAIALALDVFAVSVGVGVRGVTPGLKIRIGLAFASAEVSMCAIGAVLGAVAGRLIGDVAAYIGFIALVVLGLYMVVESRNISSESGRMDLSKGWGLFVAALSISMDSLGIGFSIMYIGVPMPVSLMVIAAVSVMATAAGLALGERIGAFADRYAAFGGGLMLALTGAAFIVLKALNLD